MENRVKRSKLHLQGRDTIGQRQYFKAFMLKFFLKLTENTKYLRIPARISKKKCVFAYVVVKLQNTKDKRIFKSNREGQC